MVQALAIGHHRAGHRVSVIAVLEPDAASHPFVVRLRQEGVLVEELRVPAKSYFAERRGIRALLRSAPPDVVHTHGYRCDLLDAGVARSLGIPIVSTMHGSSRLGGRSHLFEWLQLRAWRRFDAVVAVSRPLEAMLRDAGVARERIHVVANAWPGVEPMSSRDEARRRLGIGTSEFVVGFVGRLIRAKGPDILLGALAALPEGPWRAVLVGDGNERPALDAMVAAQGHAARVSFTGHLDDATELYRAFDVFVLSSRTEGTPIALFEAMAASVPVIATRVGGVPDVVSGHEALLVPANDASAIADAIADVRRDGAAAGERARRARARVVSEFGATAWLRRHEELYRSVMPRGR